MINLPIEIKSKIMYSGFIRHPTADIIRDFKKEHCGHIDQVYDFETECFKDLNFYDYLKDNGYLYSNKYFLLYLYLYEEEFDFCLP